METESVDSKKFDKEKKKRDDIVAEGQEKTFI